MNGVDEIVNAFFYFCKLLAKNRQCATLGIELCYQRIGKSVKKYIIKDELLNSVGIWDTTAMLAKTERPFVMTNAMLRMP